MALFRDWKIMARLVAQMGVVGLVSGGLGAWIGLLSNTGSTGSAELCANFFWLLVPGLPLALLLLANPYLSPPEAGPGLYLRFALGGMLGALVASPAFIVVATNVPVIFAKADPALQSASLLQLIGWLKPLLVILASGFAGIIWVARQHRKVD